MQIAPNEIVLRYLLPPHMKIFLRITSPQMAGQTDKWAPPQFFLFTICIAFYLNCFSDAHAINFHHVSMA
jgi:hypothetical protein